MTPTRRFAFRLALALGEPNPDRMLSKMPHRVWREWHEYHNLEPFGSQHEDNRFGVAFAGLANTRRGKKQRKYKPKQFIVQYKQPMKQRSPDAMLSKMMALTRAMGGTIVDNREANGSSD